MAVLLSVVISVLVGVSQCEYTYFSDHTGIGIRNPDGGVCLLLSFGVQLLNLNLGKDVIRETLPIVDSVLGGRCGTNEDSRAYLSAKFSHLNRTRTLRFEFSQATVMVDRYEQLRWVMKSVSYSEAYAGQKVLFSNRNETTPLSGPLKQKFTCRDNINMTLFSDKYEPVHLFFVAPLEIQPYGLSSNIYLCERTRKRSLSESLETKATIASGVVLLLSSMGVIVGHTLRRHFLPERKRAYDNLG